MDDNPENLLAEEVILKQLPCHVVKALNGAEAVHYLSSNEVAVVLLDVQMPRMDGFETAQRIRKLPNGKSIPIVFVTAIDDSRENILRAYQSGAIDFVFKPLDEEVLRAKVSTFLELYHVRRHLTDTANQEREAIAEKYRDLVESMDHAIIWSAEAGTMRFSFVSPRATNMTGFDLKNWMNEPHFWWSRIPQEDHALVHQLVQDAMNGDDRSIEHRFIHADGRTLWFHTGMRRAKKGKGVRYEVRGLSTDVTRLKEIEASLVTAEEDQKFRAELMKSFAGASRVGEVIGQVTRALAVKLNVSRCFLNEIDDEQAKATIHQDFAQNLPSLAGTYDLVAFSEILDGWRSDQTIVVDDVTTDARTKGNAKEHLEAGIRSFISIPFHRHQKLVGSLNVGTEHQRQWTLREIGLTRQVAETIWSAFENVRLLSRVKESEEEFRTLADSISQLAWMAHENGDVFWFNQRWYDYTGTRREEMLGWGWQKVISPIELPKVVAFWQLTLKKGEPASLEFPIQSKSGETRWFLTKVTPIKDEKGKVTRWFGTNTDIQLERSIREELRIAKEAAETANASKSRFLANMSHEIRTPMSAVLGFTEILRNPDIPEEDRQDALSRIDRAGRSLLRLIDDVLDISRIEAGKLALEQKRFSPLEIATEVVSLLRIQAEQKGVALKIRIAPDVPQIAFSDPSRLRQILMNLVGNAVKFTSKGEVLVQVKTKKGKFLCFHVYDTGIGISQNDQSKLFQPFAQADESITRKFGGTGLGLILSKRLSEQLGGDLWLAESKLNKGSHFVVEVVATPFTERTVQEERESEEKESLSQAEPHKSALKGARILVAEDVVDNQILLRRYLETAGASVDFAGNGEEAVSKAISRNYDLVLMDVQMPVLDGIQATIRLRNLHYSRPILAITAHAMPEEIQRSVDAGCDEHLTKPVTKRALIEAVERHMCSPTIH